MSEYLQKALRLFDKSPSQNYKAKTLEYHAVWQILFGDTIKAFSFIEMAIKINESQGNNVFLCSNYHNLGCFYLETKNYAKAQKYLLYTLELCEKTGSFLLKAHTYRELGTVYVALKQYDRAIELFERLRIICAENNFLSIIPYISSTLSKLYFYQQDYKKSAQNLWQYSLEKDSIRSKLNIAEQRILFEKSTKEQEEYIKETISRNRIKIFILLSVILLLVVVLMLFYINLRNKRRWLERIEEKK